MLAKRPKWVIVLDQGSRGGKSVIDDREARVLVVDHHLSDEFPEGAMVCICVYMDGIEAGERANIVGVGRLSMPLPTRRHHRPLNLRDLQTSPPGYREQLRVPMCHGHTRRPRDDIEMETPVPGYGGDVSRAFEEGD